MTDYSVSVGFGDRFTNDDTRKLLILVLKRFHHNLADAHAAWQRLLGDCSNDDFLKMITDLNVKV